MPAYDRVRFSPPAPVAQVTLRNPDSGVTVQDVLMLLDTGADITLVPQSAILLLDIPIQDNLYELNSFDGGVSFASTVQLELIFLRRTFRGQFLLIDQEYGILGRNVLNKISLFLDGPQLKWDDNRSV